MKKVTRVSSNEEESTLMREAAPHLKEVIQMALQTGMWLREILKLKIEDVDFPQEEIRIRTENNKTGKLDVIPIRFPTRALISKLIEENAGRTKFVFSYLNSRTGKLRPVGSIQHAFQAACRMAKIENLQFRASGGLLAPGSMNWALTLLSSSAFSGTPPQDLRKGLYPVEQANDKRNPGTSR